jgi:hypothetical protein
MVPDFAHYLAVMRRTMRDVIIPALPPTDQLVLEQAQLMAAVCDVMAEQWEFLDVAESIDLTSNLDCATAMARLANGLPGAADATERIEDISRGAGGKRLAGMRSANALVRTATDELMTVIDGHGSPDQRAAMMRAALDHAERFGALARSRYRLSRLDPEWEALPTLQQIGGLAASDEMTERTNDHE